MTKEWIDIVDTAVKIGFGSVITGSFAYLSVKASHSSEKQKFMLENKIKLVEKASDDIESYFRSSDSYLSVLSGITKIKRNDGEEGRPFDIKEESSISERDVTLVEGWHYQKSAISRLRLLKAEAVVEALEDFNQLLRDFRNRINFECDTPTHDEVLNFISQSADKKVKVQKSLADFYDEFNN